MLILILFLHFAFVGFIYNNLYPIHYAPLNLFFSELLGKPIQIPIWILFILETGNVFLLWLIGKRIFSKYPLIVPLIYAISPWSSYLLIAGSFYIYLLFLILIGFYGLLILKSKKLLGIVFVSGAILGLIYSSIHMLLILPIFFLMLFFQIVPINNLKTILITVVILTLPLFYLIYVNYVGFKNILNNEIKVFSDPGLLNMVNSYQGSAQKEGLGELAKISENKYVFSLENVLLKYTKQLVPSNYFTSQEKLLNFSFTPPIFLGFLIPFIYGFYLLIKGLQKRALIVSSLLVIPSVFSRHIVDLNRLIIFAPVVIIVTCYGLIELIKQKNSKTVTFFLYLSICLIVFQLFVVLNDIQSREKARFIKYYEFEKNYEVGKQ